MSKRTTKKDSGPSREELWERCSEVAQLPNILESIAAVCEQGGWAGPTTGLRLTYLAATTRLFSQPVSIALRGPSAAGKSFTMKRALAFIPDEEYIEATAMSEKALVYLDRDLKHKMLVVYEGAGLSNEFMAYAIRSLLSEGKLEYAYTNFERKTTEWLVKEGPTGLITSTAGGIDFELSTRVITPSVEDTPELTRAIMRAEARKAQGNVARLDSTKYQDFQRWLTLGPRDVVVPFADVLSEATDSKSVRLRRDFPAVLGLVMAHALIQQQDRDLDDRGRIVATPADYAPVYELAAEMVAEAAGATVPASVRETVVAVAALGVPPMGSVAVPHVTIAKVASELGISRSSASRRVKRAMIQGYLKDVSIGKGSAKLLERGEDLPGDTAVLPSPAILK